MTKQNTHYSGIFFWLATAALVMPFFVAVAAFRDLPKPYTYAEINPDASGVDLRLWDQLLRNYVAGGLVDYDGFKRDRYFDVFLSQLASAQPEELPSEAHRLALHLNAYNALVINGVITHGVHGNVLTDVADGADHDGDGDTAETGVFFDLEEHLFAGQTLSLNELEKQKILPVFNDPRVHMALVCAARSCPAIRSEAYTGARVDEQLEDQATQFANSPTHVRWDAAKNRLQLNPILDWYAEDFSAAGGALQFLERRVDNAEIKRVLTAAAPRQDASQSDGAGEPGRPQVSFFTYDWTLNAQGDTSGSGAGEHSSFGSGSIPNE